ncbi:MAG TPA: FtsX-like permease family protein [Terracidiphilus sp.]|nr:FtsX-like permease family protein [Terracidiphilus sp.]
MAKRALSWRRAAAIGWRDLKSAPGKFAFVVLSVAVGVAALVGVRGLSDSFRRTLSGQARSLMAGDLSARIFHPPGDKEQKKISDLMQQQSGLRTTWATETVSMASVPQQQFPLLVSLKAVDPNEYPYYGAAELQPAMSLRQALAGDSAIVADEFLIRLNAHVGDTLRLGNVNLHITAVLTQEPDRITSGAGLGPRVMISQETLKRTGLIAPGSRISERLLVKLPEQAPGGLTADKETADIRSKLESALPDAQVMDFREGNPALSRGLDNATSILSLICLVAMVLGAIGVAMAMHAHLEQRMDMLAILKALGAGSGDLLRIFLLQTMGLGLAGALLGVVAGVLVMAALPSAFGTLVPVHAALVVPWQSGLAGLGTGLLTTLLFCLPPLLDVRGVRPVLVLRRLVEQGPGGIHGFFGRWLKRWPQILLSVGLLLPLIGIAWVLSDSAAVGIRFGLAFAGALVVLLILAAVTLFALRLLLDGVRLQIPSSLRHGLANLYRPGNQSAPVLAALGTGVMLILAVYLIQTDILRDLRETASPKLPNVFLADIRQDQVDGMKSFFAHQQGLRQELNLIPIVAGRFVTIDGKPLDQLKGLHFPVRMLESAELSWTDVPLEGDKVTAGAWWKDKNAAEIAIGEGVAQRLNLKVGSSVELETGGVTRILKVGVLFRTDGQHLSSRVQFIVPSGLVGDQPSTWYGGVRIDPKQVGMMERGLFAAYPTVTVINVADVLSRIESVVDQITFVVRLLAGFSILAGLMILASSIASTRFRRMREAVVLKTLGATRMRIVGTFSVEFSVLGLLAGAVGVVFANILTRVLLRRLDVGFHIEWGATMLALFGTAALATATGWIASYRILGLRPLEVLREE